MKVLLIQPPFFFGDNRSTPPVLFALGLGYIARAALNSGHDVKVLDIFGHQYSDQEVIRIIQEMDYDIVGISALSTQYAYVKWLTEQLKKYNRMGLDPFLELVEN